MSFVYLRAVTKTFFAAAVINNVIRFFFKVENTEKQTAVHKPTTQIPYGIPCVRELLRFEC